MSTEVSGSDRTATSVAESSLGAGWRTLMGVGVVLGLLGLLAILFPFVTGVSLSILLGIVLVGGAVVHAVNVFRVSGWTGRLWQLILTIIYAVAGFSLIINPVIGLTTLTILLVAYLLVNGLAEIVMGASLRGEGGWGWLVASGVVSLALAWLLWIGWPANAAWAVGLLVGVSLLTSGIAMIGVAWRGRKAVESMAPAEAGASGS